MNVWTWGECRVNADELMHYGISGQKHGIRRYQNEDGTLTEEGIARYRNKKDYSGKDDGVMRTLAKSSFIGRNSAARFVARKTEARSKVDAKDAKIARDAASRAGSKKEQDRLNKRAQKLEKRSVKLKERSEAQKAANANKKAYEDHTSTKKMVAQDLLLSKYGAQNYRAARARGAGRMRSLLESTAGVGLLGTVLAAKGNKKKYGKRIVLSAFGDNEYTANALDD